MIGAQLHIKYDILLVDVSFNESLKGVITWPAYKQHGLLISMQ